MYAVEASEFADRAELLMENNELADKVLVFNGRVEEVAITEKVDLIISEWMGTLLIFVS